MEQGKWRVMGKCVNHYYEERSAMTAQESLLPCPFCGGEAEIEYEFHDFYGSEIRCKSCFSSSGHVDDDKDSSKAIAAWNRRHPVARTPLSDDDVGLWIVRTLGAASKQGKYSAIRNCVPLGAELVPFFLEFAGDHGITQEKQG